MFRFLIRLIGLLLLAGAFAALIVDGTRSVADGRIALLPLGRLITYVSPEAFVKLHAGIETHWPSLWDPVMVTVLLLPSWCVLGLVGLVFMALARPPRPKIGYLGR
ncbi:hypothetical protein RHAL1_04129 [Beijerinckiaceae bacterium RH AL1]|jgi:hypothetical protein|nr:hypothetical protein RHCH11_RHCH11_04051 [Beijerinckiaceae bacterium RH CH11]VVB50087.1 hypothetical protein RHAL8_04048 [Beijerinckiaceae bacterium RH AL8]VVC57190.1 hypothetical protein RHAL1_04129 [Beijerinckiaceae bacterium RH AL1]